MNILGIIASAISGNLGPPPAIAVGDNNTPYIFAYPWSSGFGSKYADPASLPGSAVFAVDFSPSGNDIAVANSNTPFISAYPWSSGFGTKYANPASLPPATGREIGRAHV